MKLYFANSKNILEKGFIYGNYFLELDSPVFDKLKNDLIVLKDLLSPFVNRFERKQLLVLRNALYHLSVGISNIKKFELLNKRGDLDRSTYQKGIRQLRVITNNDKEITLMRYIDTVNKKLL